MRNSQDLWTGDYHFIEVPHTAVLGKRWCVNRFAVRSGGARIGSGQYLQGLDHTRKRKDKQMYHTIVKRIATKNFERVNDNDYDALLKDCAPNIHHRFGGHHALGGERHDRETLRRWFQRLGRLCPTLKLTVHDVWVKGWPHNTTIIIRGPAPRPCPTGHRMRTTASTSCACAGAKSSTSTPTKTPMSSPNP